MRYSTIVEKNDKTLLEIIDMLEQFEKDKFIAGLQMRHYSQFQIEQTLDMVRSRIMGISKTKPRMRLLNIY